MVEMQCEMARPNEKIFETKKIVEGFVIVESVVKWSQMAACSLFLDWRGLVAGCLGQ